jgi:putative transposase
MAGADRMAIEEVVRRVLVDEHADVLRESVELAGPAVDGGRGVRADRRRARRAHRGPCHASQRLSAPAVGHQGGEIELQIPKIRQGSYFPSFLAPRKCSEQVSRVRASGPEPR